MRSERLAEFAKSKQSEGYERPTQLKRRSNMAIYPKIETRRAKRRNGAAYQHRRRRSLTGGHSVIAHGRRMEYQRSRSMFLTHGIARLTAKSWSDRALLPRKRARSAHAQLFAHRLRSPTWSHVCAGPLNSYIFFQILRALSKISLQYRPVVRAGLQN